MLQLVANDFYELASWGTARIDENAQDAICTRDRHRHFEATPNSASACAFRDVHEAIGRIDRLEESSERRRSLDALGDGVGDLWTLGPETRKSLEFVSHDDVVRGDKQRDLEGQL
jgi:hypothetical protein